MQKEIGLSIRRLRREKELTLDALAKRTGLSKGYLSRLERGLKSPPISTLSNIAGALGVEMTMFFQKETNQPKITIVRPDERTQITRDSSTYGYYYEALAENFHPKSIETFIITLTAKAESKTSSKTKEFFSHEGEEMIFVLSGKISFSYDEEVYACGPGDCIYFDARVKHRADCVGPDEAKALVVIAPKGRVNDPAKS